MLGVQVATLLHMVCAVDHHLNHFLHSRSSHSTHPPSPGPGVAPAEASCAISTAAMSAAAVLGLEDAPLVAGVVSVGPTLPASLLLSRPAARLIDAGSASAGAAPFMERLKCSICTGKEGVRTRQQWKKKYDLIEGSSQS